MSTHKGVRYMDDDKTRNHKKKNFDQISVMPRLETCQLINSKNRRAVLFVKIGMQRGYELKKEQTWPQFRYSCFGKPNS